MAREKVSGIYRIAAADGREYIGGTSDLRKRFTEHRGMLHRHEHPNVFLQRLYDDVGDSGLVYELIDPCKPEDLVSREQFAIDTRNPSCNIERKVGKVLAEKWADPAWRELHTQRCIEQNENRSQEAREKARLLMQKFNTAEVRRAASERLKALWQKPEFRAIASANASAVLKARFAQPGYAEQHGRRLSAIHKKRFESAEVRAAHKARLQGINRKAIVCVNTGEVFASVQEAADAKGICVAVISKQRRGLPTRSAITWRDATDDDLSRQGMDRPAGRYSSKEAQA